MVCVLALWINWNDYIWFVYHTAYVLPMLVTYILERNIKLLPYVHSHRFNLIYYELQHFSPVVMYAELVFVDRMR